MEPSQDSRPEDPPAPSPPGARQASSPRRVRASWLDFDKMDSRIRRIKHRCRSELDPQHWNRYNLAGFEAQYWNVKDGMPRVDVSKITWQEFIEQYEGPGRPCVLTGVTSNWMAKRRWTEEKLLRRFGDERFKVGEDDDGDSVYMRLRYFMYYAYGKDWYLSALGASSGSDDEIAFDGSMPSSKASSPRAERDKVPSCSCAGSESLPGSSSSASDRGSTRKRPITVTTDDSPLYIFDSAFAEYKPTCELLEDYDPPLFFKDDLFNLVSEKKRPPYRWVVMGPARSGTTLHQDPLGTSAWNTLLLGHKRWVLFPPHAPRHLVNPKRKKDVNEVTSWFEQVYPITFENEEPFKPIDVIQGPGETMFVPSGWWHAVMNLDATIAVTQNFCSRTNFEAVWLRTRHSRAKMAGKWRDRLVTGGFVSTQLDSLDTVPMLPPSSSESSDSSSSSSSSSSSGSEASETEGEKGGDFAPAGVCGDANMECEPDQPQCSPAQQASSLRKRPRSPGDDGDKDSRQFVGIERNDGHQGDAAQNSGPRRPSPNRIAHSLAAAEECAYQADSERGKLRIFLNLRTASQRTRPVSADENASRDADGIVAAKDDAAAAPADNRKRARIDPSFSSSLVQ